MKYGLLSALLLLSQSVAAEVRFDAELPEAGHYHFAPAAGHVLLVNYWATWCAPCRQEMPLLDGLYRKYHARGLDMVGVSVDERSDAPQVRRMAQQVSYPLVMAEQATLQGASRVWGVPMNYLVDGQGRAVIDGQPGFQAGDLAQLESRILQLLDALPAQSKR